jgi:hypothetical protein
MKKLRRYFLFLLLLAGSLPLFGDNEFGLRLMPVFNAPLDVQNFEFGVGAAASLDWSFLSLEKSFSLGLQAGGGYSSLGTADGSSFGIFEGGAGPFLGWRVLDRLLLRADLNAGIYQYQWEGYSNTRPRIEIGLGVYYHLFPYLSLFVNGAYTWYAFAETRPINTFKTALGVSLNLGEILRPQARIKGERTRQEPVFPVSYAWYRNNSFATVQITNNEPNAISGIEVSFFLEQYMNQRTVFGSLPRLAQGESAELPVTALFNDSMLDLTENTDANGEVQINYWSLGARKQSRFSVQIPVFHRNTMSWDDDKRAASFVSARDPSAILFAKSASSAVRKLLKPDVSVNVQQALTLFETLNIYGMNYVIDPSSSYVKMSENTSSLDSLNYPYQTLYYRGGDCDDLSILFCSLLEVLGIDTAFITIPGHIFIAFDVGTNNGFIKSEDLIEYNGKFWMPVEITIPAEGFCNAWRTGIREWKEAGENGAVYPMRESWNLYQPVSVPGAGELLPAMPEDERIIQAFEAELTKLESLH